MFGNIIGSNIVNLLLILGLSAVIKPLVLKKETIIFEIPICLAITIIFACFYNTGFGVSKTEGMILLVLFVMFIFYTIFVAKNKQKIENKLSQNNFDNISKNSEPNSKNRIFKNIIFVVLGIISLEFGGDLAVENAIIISNFLGLSQKIIGITVLAIGTSLPELVTSTIAAFKGNSDIAIRKYYRIKYI